MATDYKQRAFEIFGPSSERHDSYPPGFRIYTGVAHDRHRLSEYVPFDGARERIHAIVDEEIDRILADYAAELDRQTREGVRALAVASMHRDVIAADLAARGADYLAAAVEAR